MIVLYGVIFGFLEPSACLEDLASAIASSTSATVK